MPQDRYAHERGDPAVPQCGSSPVHILFDGCPLMLRWTLAAVTIAGAVWVTADMLNEAYGAGPPYYGRTVNMDKWTSPWLALVVIDGLLLLIAVTLVRGVGDKRR